MPTEMTCTPAATCGGGTLLSRLRAGAAARSCRPSEREVLLEMNVDIALFASLSDYHTQPGDGHTRRYELAAGTTIADVITMFALPDQPRIIFVKGIHAEETAELHEGERLAIFPPIAGG